MKYLDQMNSMKLKFTMHHKIQKWSPMKQNMTSPNTQLIGMTTKGKLNDKKIIRSTLRNVCNKII